MKKDKYYWGLSLIILTVIFAACKKNASGPSIDNYFLNYQIQEIPVTQDYVVGAFYYSWSTFNTNIKEVPVLGKYTSPSGKIPANIMAQHIDQANSGGIDYFLFQIRSRNLDSNNYKNDSTLISIFLQQNTSNKMKFALYYNLNTSAYGITATNPLENNATRLNQFYNDFVRLAPFFQNSNYQKVNGKTLLYITNSNNLYSNKDSLIYDTLRNKLSAIGFNMYLVGYQERWSPPARYAPYRFKGGVDAVYEQSYSSQVSSWDRWYLLPQMIDQNWEYSKKYFADSCGLDFIPNISPAYNWQILNAGSTNPSFPRTDSGKLYRTLCNVCKMNANPNTRLILIDSWNQWEWDTQLEPAASYGNLYLNITKSEFKK